MNKETKTYIGTSILLAILLFVSGFYTGKNQNNNSFKELSSSFSTTTEPIPTKAFFKVWEILDEKFSPASSTLPKITDTEKMWGATMGLAAAYKDPYTVFFPPAESKSFGEEIAGSFGGVGMEIGVEDGILTIVTPLKGTPSFNAGILPGDKLIAIDDVSVINYSIDQAVRLIRGEVGTPVVVTLVRKGEKEPIKKTLVRAVIEIPTVNTKYLAGDNVFVIELYNFSANSANLFRGALREFINSGADKLVIDLRNNPGGYLEAALDMASWFLPTGKTVVIEDFGGKQENREYKSKGYDIFTDNLKLAILVNEGSASASEILAGALKEHKKATLIGQNTFGKGSVQELIEITKETSLKVTVAHWMTPDGNSISEQGIKPDIEVVPTKENTKDGNDPVLNRAVEFLKNGK